MIRVCAHKTLHLPACCRLTLAFAYSFTPVSRAWGLIVESDEADSLLGGTKEYGSQVSVAARVIPWLILVLLTLAGLALSFSYDSVAAISTQLQEVSLNFFVLCYVEISVSALCACSRKFRAEQGSLQRRIRFTIHGLFHSKYSA